METKRILIFGLIFGAFSLIFPIRIFAADLNISCNQNDCIADSQDSLFNHTNISPGFSIIKSIRVDNLNTDTPCELELQAKRKGEITTPDLAGKLFIAITKDEISVFGSDTSRTMADFLNKSIILGEIPANSSSEYIWRIDFNTESGNSYQQLSVSFDFDLTFTCNTTDGDLGSSLGATTSRSSRNFLSRVLGNVLRPQEEKLEENNYSETKSESPAAVDEVVEGGSILGEKCENTLPWWIIPLLQLIIELVTIAFLWLKNSLTRPWFVPIMTGILFQTIYYILGCTCTNDHWCTKYLYINLGLTIITLVGVHFIKHKNPH